MKFTWLKITVSLFIILFAGAAAAATHAPRVHCEADTVKVEAILTEISSKNVDFPQRMVLAAKALLDSPRSESVEYDSLGTVMINLHSFDPVDFLSCVLSIAQTSALRQPTWRDYAKNLEKISRVKGEDTGFASKLKYGAQWIVDNVYRGNVKDMTEYFDGSVFKTRTLDHFTRNRDKYPALADSAIFESQRMIEMGYRSHKVPHMKKQTIANKNLLELFKPGDVIMMLSNDEYPDVFDIGIISLEGEPHLIHIGLEEGKVTEDPYPISRLFKLQNQHFYGFRWLRPQE